MPLSLEDRHVLEAASIKLMDTFTPFELLPGLVAAGILSNGDKELIVNKVKEFGNRCGMMELLDRYKRRAENLEPLKSILRQEGHDVDEEYFQQVDPHQLQKESANVSTLELSEAINDVVSQANGVYRIVDLLATNYNETFWNLLPNKTGDSILRQCSKCMRDISPVKEKMIQMKTDISLLKSSTNTLVGTNLKHLQEALKELNRRSSGKRIEEGILYRDVKCLLEKLVEERKELANVISYERTEAFEKFSGRLPFPKFEREIELVKERVDTLETKLEQEFKSTEEQELMPTTMLYEVKWLWTPLARNQDIKYEAESSVEDVNRQVEQQSSRIAELEKQNKEQFSELLKKQEEFEEILENLNEKAKLMEEQTQKTAQLEQENRELFNVQQKEIANETKNNNMMIKEVELKFAQNQREMFEKTKELDELTLNVSMLNETIQELKQNLKSVDNAQTAEEPEPSTAKHHDMKQNIAWLLGGRSPKGLTTIEIFNPNGPTIRSLTHLQLKTPRRFHNCVVVHDKLYIIGGMDSFSKCFDAVEVFAPYSKTAIECALVLKQRRAYAATTTKDQYIFVFGGSDESSLTSSECLDVSHGVFESVAPMPSGRYYHTAECIGDCMYLIGGVVDGSFSNSGLVYHPNTNTYTSNNYTLLERRSSHASAVEESTIVATGGFDGNNSLSSSERYDPRDGNKSMRLADMKHGRHGHALVNIGGQLVALGGTNGDKYLDSIEVYDSRMDKWTVFETKLLQPRAFFGAAVV